MTLPDKVTIDIKKTVGIISASLTISGAILLGVLMLIGVPKDISLASQIYWQVLWASMACLAFGLILIQMYSLFKKA